MTDRKFDVYLLGDIQPGLVRNQVVANLAEVFKREPQAIEAMLAKPRSLIKRDLDEARARKYQQVINDAGGLCDLVAVKEELTLEDMSVEPIAAEPEQEPEQKSEPDIASAYATPAASPSASRKFFCSHCGNQLTTGVVRCPKCGTPQQHFAKKDKVLAGVLAFFVGGLGIHRFYLGQWWGIFYLIFWPTLIPSIVSVIEAIVFWASSQASWDRKYGQVPRDNTVLVVIVSLVGLVFLVGILAAISLPAYMDYTRRAQVKQSISSVQQAQLQVEDFVEAHSRYPQAGEIDIATPQSASKLDRIDLLSEGRLEVVYDFGNAETTIIWEPRLEDDQLQWNCTGGTLENRYRPTECRDAAKKSGSGYKRLYAPERRFSIEVPSSWKENNNLSEDATLGAANLVQEGYVLVIVDPFEDLGESLDLDEYADLILSNMSSNIDNPRYGSELTQVVIDGWPGYQMVLHGEIENLKVTYLITLLERENNFYQVISWTLSSRFDRKREEFQYIAQSFRELDAR